MLKEGRKNRILGIDPAINNIGWAIIDKEGNNVSYVDSGVVKNKVSNMMNDKLENIYLKLNDVITSYKPDIAVIEKTFVNKNPLSSLTLGHARGAIILTITLHKIVIIEHSATYIKKSACGNGKATKEQIINLVNILFPRNKKISDDNEADAVIAALSYNGNSRI